MDLILYFRVFIFFVDIAMIGYILNKNSKSMLNITCALLILSYAIWTFGATLSLRPDIAVNNMILFQNISSIGWISCVSFVLCFSLAFSKRETLLKKKWVLIFIFILPVIFIFKQWTSSFTFSVPGNIGWEIEWKDKFWEFLFHVYSILFALLSLYLIFRYGIQTNIKNKKKQFKTLIVTGIICFLTGTIIEAILPLFDNNIVLSTGDLFNLISACGIVYAIIKYEFLVISPSFAADNILSTMVELLILTDQEGSIINVNKAVTDTLKFDQKELSGKSIATFLSHSHLTITLLERITQGEIIKNHDAYLLVKDAGEIPVIFSCSPLKDKKGEMIGIVFVASDNTERKQAEEALAREQNLTNSLMNNLPDYIYIKDKESRFVKISNAHAKSFGLSSAEEAVGKTDFDFFSEEHARQAYNDEQEIIQTGKLLVKEEKETRPDRPDTWVSTLKFPLINQDGDIDGIFGISIDITERKQAEDVLAQERYLMNALMNNLPDYIYFKDKESRFIKISVPLAHLFGISVPTEAIGKTDFDFFSEEHARQAYNDEQEIIRSDKLLMKEEKETWPDRPDTWVSTTKLPLLNQEGKIVGTFGVSRDITERIRAEEALKESDRLLNESQEVAGLGSYAWDLTNGLWTSSKILDRIFGIDESYVRSFEGWQGIIHPAFREMMQNYVANEVIGKKQKFDKEYRIVNQKNKQEYWVHGLGKLEFDSNHQPAKLIGTITDITGRKIVEEQLCESEEKLRALFGTMTEMLVLHELVFNEEGEAIDYRIIDCNNSFTQITGIKKEDAIGKTATEVYQTEDAPYLEIYSKVAVTGESYEFNTYDVPLDKYFLISVVSPRENMFATITMDVSEIQQKQEEIKDKNKELENYLYVASHDLRSPLVNIQGFSQRFKKQSDTMKNAIDMCTLETETKQSLDKLTNEDIPKTLNFILSNVAKMENLISGLLQISRTGRVVMTIKKVNMNHLIKTIIAGNNFQITELSAKVIIEDLPECYGDENLLNQLFSNIIGNAFKYRDSNRQMVIEINFRTKFNKVVYSVKDTGIGIETRHLEKIWDVFYRVDPGSEVQGDGIGLNVVKRIVEKHKGKIWVESEVGKGSVFYIELQKNEFME